MAKKRTANASAEDPVNETAKVFGLRMGTRREKLGMSLYAMAKRTGLSAEGLGKIEKGQREPSWTTVQLIAAALDLTYDELANPAVGLRDYTPTPKGRPKKASADALPYADQDKKPDAPPAEDVLALPIEELRKRVEREAAGKDAPPAAAPAKKGRAKKGDAK